MRNSQKLKTGDRLRIIRELIGLTQREFASFLGIEMSKLKNIEYKRNRVTEEIYEKIGENFPELLKWFVYEGPVDLPELRNSDSKYCKFIAARFDAGLVPEEYFPEDLIRDNDLK